MFPASSFLILRSHQVLNVQPALGNELAFLILLVAGGVLRSGQPPVLSSEPDMPLSPGVQVQDALEINPHISAGQGFGIWGQFMFLHPPSSAKRQALHLYALSVMKLYFSWHKPPDILQIYQVLSSKSIYFFLLADCRMWGGLCLMQSG